LSIQASVSDSSLSDVAELCVAINAIGTANQQLVRKPASSHRQPLSQIANVTLLEATLRHKPRLGSRNFTQNLRRDIAATKPSIFGAAPA
jgi:hypothetical protein